MAQYPAAISLSRLDGSNGFKVINLEARYVDNLTVASAGDVNNDGYDDIIFGSPDTSDRAGASYVAFGAASGFGAELDVTTLDGNNGFAVVTDQQDWLGSPVASAGDINGDGFDDVIVGAVGGEQHGKHESGAAFVVFGKASGFDASLNVADLDGTNGFQILAEAAYDDIGSGVAAAGDVNGDGIDDLIVGALQARPNGASYVIFGSTAGFGADFDLSKLNGHNGFQITGAADQEESGARVAGAGDVNGDGFNDILIGAFGGYHDGVRSDAAYVLFGHKGRFDANVDLSRLDGNNGFSISGLSPHWLVGPPIATAGDFNGDGYADIVIGVPDAVQDSGGTGDTYVLYGKASGFAPSIDLDDFKPSDGLRIVGTPGDGSGYSVAGAGDVNGDGFDDVIIGAPNGHAAPDQTRHPGTGASYVVFGSASGHGGSINLADLDGTNGFEIYGEKKGDGKAITVASAGDVNGDGLADLAISEPYASSGSAAYVVFSRLPDAPVARTGTGASQNLVGGDFDDMLRGRGGDDVLYGNGGSDTAWGGLGSDDLRGGAGADRLFGGNGADSLAGGDGADVLNGGPGGDLLSGGAGRDRFVFSAVDGHGAAFNDTISDLDADDVIDLRRIDADTTQPGNQAFHLVASLTGQAGELAVHFHPAGGNAGYTTVKADIDGDGVADVTILLAGDHSGFSSFML